MLRIQNLFMEKPPHCHAHLIFCNLCSTSGDTEVLHRTSEHALFHINCSCTSPCSAACCRRVSSVNSASLSGATINGVKRAFGSLHWGYLSAYILRAAALLPRPLPRIKCMSAHSRNVYLSILRRDCSTERTALDCRYISLELNAWCHMLVHVVNLLLLYTWQLYILLPNWECGNDKRQIVIHIVHNKLQISSNLFPWCVGFVTTALNLLLPGHLRIALFCYRSTSGPMFI
jgi:hypothetical protein